MIVGKSRAIRLSLAEQFAKKTGDSFKVLPEEKEFSRLKRKTLKLVEKTENKGIELSDIEISAISRVGHANSMKDISWLVEKEMERIFEKYKIR